MNSYRARRATTDDLQQLIELWQASQFPVLDLEKRFTEFQIVQDLHGKVLGAIGIQMAGLDARVHSETFADFALTDTLRPMLWDRVQAVAKNNGIFRLWTTETAPFWKKDAGFAEPSEALMQKYPETLGPREAHLLMLQMRNESASPEALERELAQYLQSEQQKRDNLIRQAKALKIAATIFAALLFLFAIVMGVLWIAKHPPTPLP